MEAVPLLPKAKVLPNLDAAPLIRELFQDEFQAAVPTKKLSQNILTSLEHPNNHEDDLEAYNSVDSFQNLTIKRENVVEFTDNVFQAYKNHENNLKEIKNAEEHIFETHVHFLNREKTILENQTIRDLLTLKRHPVFKALDAKYVKKYKLLQGEAGLPPEHELKSDFRVHNFKKWRKRLESNCQGNMIMSHVNREPANSENCRKLSKRGVLREKEETIKKPQNTKKKNKNCSGKPPEIFKAEPNMLFFTDYKLGDIYIAEIKVKNIHQKGIQFQLKPMDLDGPFRVMLNERSKMKVSPGLSFYLNVEFTPKSLDNAAEDIVIATEDGNRFLIPLIAYLEPPVLKTHKDVNEFTKTTSEKILNSYIECGVCFTGDTKVTKLSFRCYRGSGEFFIMSSENWNRSYINTVTVENLLEIPPFRVYPVFFKMEKDEVIDLFVEFVPKNSGTHVENIVIACNNGQIRSLDLIGDAVSWHSFYFSFQDSLLKDLPAEEDDDVKVKYYLDLEDTSANGKVEKVFCVSNNSDMAFEFQWKIREANITSTREKYLKLSRDQVKIDPENGTFEPNSIWEFLVTVTFSNSDVGKYRMVLSLYVLNLPYQCIQEDDTIIQPTGFVRNLYSQSLYGEEEISSPELSSLRGTYESLQESIKSYVEYQSKTQAGSKYDFCRTTCIPNPGLCAKPLKKSKTYFNIGDNLDDGDGLGCACRPRQAAEVDSNSESCNSNLRDERGNELSPLRNEVIWDFVDILVDEVELWVDVFPTRVTLEPSVIQLGRPLNVKEETIFKEVRIINHNHSPVTCSWLLPSVIRPTKRTSDGFSREQTSLALLFDKQSGNKNQKLSEDCVNSKQCRLQRSEQDDESKMESESTDLEDLSSCKISVNPKKEFMVGGLSEFTCKIGISPSRAGDIKEMLCLSVNEGDLELKVLIFGVVVTRTIETSPDILDFGVLRQGTRYTKDFLISKTSSNSLFWRINQFDFDFEKEKFFGRSDLKGPGSTKNTSGVIMKKEKSSIETYCLDARVPGIKCSLLEIEENNERHATPEKRYILVLGDVKTPNLLLSAPRFENAILALPGKMYVGQKVSTKVTLTNVGSVETFFAWGHSFGCHSRKINVEFSPKSCRIEKNNKLTVNIDLTALEEGIISHCYIPCFFCRSAEPLILSIVGLAENVKVTFEIIDYPMQTHSDPSNFLKSPFYHTVFRVSWPMKSYNPSLGLNYINECNIQQMICRCQEVDEEAAAAFGAPKNSVHELETSGKSDLSLKSFEMSYENSVKLRNSCDKKSKNKLEEDLNCSISNLSGLNSLDGRKSDENSALSCNYVQPSIESLQFCKPQLEFLNVPYQTPTLRQFVIRNETSIETSFQINVHDNGVSGYLPDRRVVMIKNRVFGYAKDDFQSKLMKEQPLVIVAEPSLGELKAFDAACINVYCYGNTWGEYRDHLICKIKGMEEYHLNIFVQIVGHPIYFPMFKTQTLRKPTLRFPTLSYFENPVSKEVKVVNRSAIPLNVSWLVFLTKPLLKDEDRENSFNLCADSNANFDSSHSGEGSTESSKNYIPKNASERTSSFPISNEPTDFGQNSDFFKSFEKSESSLSSPSMRKEKRGSITENENEKRTLPAVNESVHSDFPHFVIPGRPYCNVFKVEPKEMSFEPFEEKKISVTFDPHFCKPEAFPEEFQGVLTCCVKLKPEDEKCPRLYYRPCGIKFVSELMDFNALVEIPLLSFEILRGDMKFTVDANAVVRSEQRSITIFRKYIIKNQNQKLLNLTIEVSPGLVFKVTRVNTLDKFYPKYNPDTHNLKIDSGQLLEMELECSVTYKDILYAYEELKRKKKQDQYSTSMDEMQPLSKSSNENDAEPQMKKEPWRNQVDEFADQNYSERCSLGHKDSFELNLNRMSSKSDYSCCDNFDDAEAEGEFLELPKVQEVPTKSKPQRHVTVIEEEISFIQSGLATQSLLAQLHISFPAIKISQKSLDFGSVFLGETAVRYCTFINLTGFPTDFRVMARINSAEFVASPLTGSLPSADYNSDIGKTITIEFKPSHPGYFKELYHVYCNLDLEFDFHELFVSGFGTWNEKYRTPKFETYTKLLGIYPNLKK